ncbi:MAG: glycosyltransferase, partial [candidate division KSB1 bacterium]|nr:glycosyltransferase [candidate division KSB1 bacterium]
MKKISIIMLYDQEMKYDHHTFAEMVRSAIEQNYPHWELLLVDMRGQNAPNPLPFSQPQIRHLPGQFINQAQAINHGVAHATGEYIMLANNLAAAITFRLSTLETFLLVAERHPKLGLIYSDYCLVDKSGTRTDVHLLDYHEGRVRDNMDLGKVFFLPKAVIQQIGGMNERYRGAHWYDLRLRVAEKFDIIHIAAAR